MTLPLIFNYWMWNLTLDLRICISENSHIRKSLPNLSTLPASRESSKVKPTQIWFPQLLPLLPQLFSIQNIPFHFQIFWNILLCKIGSNTKFSIFFFEMFLEFWFVFQNWKPVKLQTTAKKNKSGKTKHCELLYEMYYI